MVKKRKGRQNQPDESSIEKATEAAKSIEASRPRIVPESKRAIQHGIEKAQQRKPRELTKTRGLGSAVHPHTSSTRLIRRQEKKFPTGRTVILEEETKKAGALKEQESLKWAAWGALVISIITLISLGVYSVREFSPEFEFHDLKAAQKQITADVDELKLTIRLEKVKTAVINARTQSLIHKDYTAAESMLATAKQEISALIGTLPVRKKTELEEALKDIEKTIQEIQRGPLSLDKKLKEITSKLDKI